MWEVVRRPSRLQALASLDANALSSADALDRIAGTACRVLDVPVALVNLVGADRQRLVGCGGPEQWRSIREMPISQGFCPFVLAADDAYTLRDARKDPAFAHDASVVDLGVVAYAGVPLRAADGEPIGTLCALDFEPRDWSDDDLTLLADLAAGVIAELQLLTATRLLARQQARLRTLTGLSSALVPARDASDVSDQVIRALDRFDANAVWLLMLDESGETLHTVATTGADADALARHADVPADAAVPPAEVIRTGQPDFLTTRADVRDRFETLLEVVPDAGSVAVLPLTAGDHHLGAMGVCFADERPFSLDDREYLAALGGVSGLALARAPR